MWKQLLKALTSGTQAERVPADGSPEFYVYRVRSPEGFKDVVSLVPHGTVFESGLAGDAIVGVLENDDQVSVANFRPNAQFVHLLHNVIATHAPTLPGLQAEAHRQRTGRVYMIDARTPTPAGAVPPHDIIGAFEVRDGSIVPHSYQPNPNHRLFSSDGLFRLDPMLQERLIERMIKATTSQKSID